jgi:hypothetical protein
MDKIFQSKIFKGILVGIGILIVFLVIFQIGVFVGLKKASFSYGWGDNYYKNFAGPRGEMMREFEGRDMMGGHGVFGSILKIETPNIIIKGSDNLEKIIATDDKTQIMNLRDPIKISNLKPDENVVVIGTPDESGKITARLIRVMPLPPEGFQFQTQFVSQTQSVPQTQSLPKTQQ